MFNFIKKKDGISANTKEQSCCCESVEESCCNEKSEDNCCTVDDKSLSGCCTK